MDLRLCPRFHNAYGLAYGAGWRHRHAIRRLTIVKNAMWSKNETGVRNRPTVGRTIDDKDADMEWHWSPVVLALWFFALCLKPVQAAGSRTLEVIIHQSDAVHGIHVDVRLIQVWADCTIGDKDEGMRASVFRQLPRGP